MAFNLDDYTTVQERSNIFWERYPNGAVALIVTLRLRIVLLRLVGLHLRWLTLVLKSTERAEKKWLGL